MNDRMDRADGRSRRTPTAPRSLSAAVAGLAAAFLLALGAPSALADDKDDHHGHHKPEKAKVTVEKRWVIDGQAYEHGSQPAGFDAVLTLTGPDGAGPTPQQWGVARGGYRAGESVTIDEAVTLADATCTLDAGRVTAANGVSVDASLPYAVQLGKGYNTFTITNQVTCPRPPPTPPVPPTPPETPPVTPPTTPPTTPPVTPPTTPPAPSARPAPPAPQIQVRGQRQVGRPRLQVEKRASARTVVAGDTVRFTLVVRNSGNAVARGVRVCDQLPDDVTVVDRNGGRLVAGGRVCWRIRSLPAGATRTRTIVLRVDLDAEGGTILNRAFVRGEGQRREAQRRVGVAQGGQQPSRGGEQVTG